MEKRTLCYLWIDDERIRPELPFLPHVLVMTARTYASAIEVLEYCRNMNLGVYADFDHDLGEEKTGYDICKFIVENQYPLVGYHLHTMNPVGMQNMEQLLSHYGYTRS